MTFNENSLVSINVAVETHIAMCDMVISLKQLHSFIERFRTSMYRQKHAFYFRMLKQWSERLSVSDGTALNFLVLIPCLSKYGVKKILGKDH